MSIIGTFKYFLRTITSKYYNIFDENNHLISIPYRCRRKRSQGCNRRSRIPRIRSRKSRRCSRAGCRFLRPPTSIASSGSLIKFRHSQSNITNAEQILKCTSPILQKLFLIKVNYSKIPTTTLYNSTLKFIRL